MALPSLPPDRQIDLLRVMLRIRRLEEAVIHLATTHQDVVRGHYHVYIGQEAVAAAVCAALGPEDYIFTTHRNHGHLVARGGDSGRILAEIIGRSGGYLQGRGGTFHVAAPELGILHTSAIVGGCLPLAAGTAFASQFLDNGRASVVFFGDGAMEEGAFYETINLAQLWRLPVIFVMENNSVDPSKRPDRGTALRGHSAATLADVPRAFGLTTVVIDGGDVASIHQTASSLVANVRRGEGPFFVEAVTPRWPGNYGFYPSLPAGDFQLAWIQDPPAAPPDLHDWHDRLDPIVGYSRGLLAQGVLLEDSLGELDAAVRAEVASAVQFALQSPETEPATATDFVFV